MRTLNLRDPACMGSLSRSKFNVASLEFPFALNRNLVDVVSGQSLITFARASSGTYVDSNGILQTASANVPRFDHNPTSGESLGLLVEEQRTNSIRNNTMQGAVAGSPGTLPTNWVESVFATGLTRQVVGTGTSNGITYIDIKVSGTTSSAAEWNVFFDANTQIAASSGQVWTGATYVAIIAGSTANMTSALARVIERNSGGGYITESNVSWGGATSTLVNNRFTVTRTLGATAAFVQHGVYFQANSGVAIDITLRIGLPQLELGAFATSVIPTTTTALTRNADVASMTGTNFSSWFNASEGTIVALASVPQPVAYTGMVYEIGSFNNGILFYRQIDFKPVDRVRVASADQFINGFEGTWTTTAQVRNAMAYKANDFAGCINGGTVATDTSGTLPTVSSMQIGQTGSTAQLNGHIQRIAYYPTRLPNATLQALTGG